MDNCKPIAFKAKTGQSTVPWQYAEQQTQNDGSLSAAFEIVDSDTIVDSSYEETLAAKWWANQIPSGLPYANYLREIYNETGGSGVPASAAPMGDANEAEARMRAQRLVYAGLSGTPVGSVSGDPMLDPNWKWEDRRAKIHGLGDISCDGTFSTSGLFCFPPFPDNSETINQLWEEVVAASADCEKLADLTDEVENSLHTMSADMLLSANEIQAEIQNKVDESIREFIKKGNSSWKYPITSGEIQAEVGRLSSYAEQILSDNLSMLMELRYAGDECNNDITTAIHEIETLLPPTPKTFSTNPMSKKENEVFVPRQSTSETFSTNPEPEKENEVFVSRQSPGGSSEAAAEPAEPLPYEPPKPHVKSEVDWWLWLMDILVTILNKVITTLIANVGIVTPMKGAAAAMASVIPAEPAPGEPTAASLDSVNSMVASIQAAAESLAAAWFVDIPIIWVYPPLIGLSSSVNILASKSMSFFDPEPGEFEDETLDFEEEEEEPEENLTGGFEAQSVAFTQSLLLDKKKIRSAVLNSIENYNDTIRSIYTKNGCTAALALFNRYHPQ